MSAFNWAFDDCLTTTKNAELVFGCCLQESVFPACFDSLNIDAAQLTRAGYCEDLGREEKTQMSVTLEVNILCKHINRGKSSSMLGFSVSVPSQRC